MNDGSALDVQIQIGFPGELERMLALATADAAALFPNSLRAVGALAQAAQERWIALASGTVPLDNGRTIRRSSGEYAASIAIEPATDTPNGVSYLIYSDAPQASWLEYGTEAWDMHKVLSTGRKVKRSKPTKAEPDGHRYLSVPMRWGSPTSLAVGAYVGRETPQPVQSWWLKRDASMITGSRPEPSVNHPGQTVMRNTYQWGDRLTPRDVADLGLDPSSGPGRHMVGMVKTGGPKQGGKMTFRTLSEANPDGWMNPGTEAQGVALSAARWLEGVYGAIMDAALNADVERIKAKLGGD